MLRNRHVRPTVSRFPGERDTHGAACVTCGIPLIFTPSKRKAARAGRQHERWHARGGR